MTPKDNTQNSNDDEDDNGGNDDDGVDHGYMGNNLDHCLGIINASLVPAFNLEICTVSLPPPYKEDDGDSANDEEEGSGRGKKRTALIKYHAIANRSNDAIAQSHSFPPLRGGGPHEMAYFRLAIEKIVECGVELLEEEGDNNSNNNASSVGCLGALNRMELINLRTEMEGAHKDKLTIAQTESALELLLEEGWLVRVSSPSEDDDGDDLDNDDDDDGEEEEEGARRKRKKRASSKKKRGSTRMSLKGTFYGIGPRSFMELGEFLQKAGLPQERMPQSILHRV